jgi:hypothetical protein
MPASIIAAHDAADSIGALPLIAAAAEAAIGRAVGAFPLMLKRAWPRRRQSHKGTQA